MKTSDWKSRGPASKLAPRTFHMAIFYLRIAKNVCGHGICKHFLKIWFSISWREAWMLPQEMNSFSLNVVKYVRKGGWSFLFRKVGEMAPGVQRQEWHQPICQQQLAPVGLLTMQMLLINVYPNLRSTINERKHALLQVWVLCKTPEHRLQQTGTNPCRDAVPWAIRHNYYDVRDFV